MTRLDEATAVKTVSKKRLAKLMAMQTEQLNRYTDKRTIAQMYQTVNSVEFNPPYQRQGGAWSHKKKCLFIDSIIKNFDIPKMYFHELEIGNPKQFDLIDGKQRYETIVEFIDGTLVLMNGYRYTDMTDNARMMFNARALDVVVLRNAPEEVIEEMFFRLNNGTKLSAAEHRNCISGDMSKFLREVPSHKFFTECLTAKDFRGAHKELAATLVKIELEYLDKKTFLAVSKSKGNLDSTVEKHRVMSDELKSDLSITLENGLRIMCRVFPKHDPLLKNPSLVFVYYLFIRNIMNTYGCEYMEDRLYKFLTMFTNAVTENEDNIRSGRDFDVDLAAYTNACKSANNRGAIASRIGILTDFFLNEYKDLYIKDDKRFFGDDVRMAVWYRDHKKCCNCKRSLELTDAHINHVVGYHKGGQTLMTNAQCLCEICNGKRSRK